MFRKSFLIIVLLLCSWQWICSQTPTTQGKEFWLAFMENEKSGPQLTLSISAIRACDLVITNPNNPAYRLNVKLNAGLNKIAADLAAQAYVTTSEQVEKKGLLITTTDTVSVFASNYLAKLFDITAVLPTTALMDEYIIQTYKNSDGKKSYPPEFLIVATENNTIVDIAPAWKTSGGKPAGVSFSVTLNKGECYQVQAPAGVVGCTLSGSTVKARDKKKIAVFNGNQSESIPYGGGDDGDHLFEQAMPIAYWGTRFAITRPMNQTIAKVCVTARNSGTSISRDGTELTVINAGETFEFDIENPDESCFLETSCPCAVYLYLVSNHKFDTAEKLGGPSMVWISPIEQMIKEINFCTYQTGETSNHYVNIVAQTAAKGTVTLSANSTNTLQVLDFYPVNGNSEYSYARVKITDDSYSLKSSKGVIAYVYGLGDNESYAYSAGSSVKVQNGISINGNSFSSGDMAQVSYCYGEVLKFSSEMKDIDELFWDMDDGVTTSDSAFTYIYDAPGSYNVEVFIKRASNPCDGSGLYDTIRVRVNMNTPLNRHYYEEVCDEGNADNSMISNTRIDTVFFGCDSVQYFHRTVNYKTYFKDQRTVYDSLQWIDGITYYESTDIPVFTLTNAAGCDSIVSLDLTVLHCLDMDLGEISQHICGDVPNFNIPYTVRKGQMSSYKAIFDEKTQQAGFRETSVTDDGSEFVVTLPSNVRPDHYKFELQLYDAVCDRTENYPLEFKIFYPSAVFAQKWNDVLAVYNENYNGGYTFSAYQWYKNGTPIEGATGSYYYVPDGLDMSAEYAVELTRVSDGVVLMSCPLMPTNNAISSTVSVQPTTAETGTSVQVNVQEQGTATFLNLMGMIQKTERVLNGENMIAVPQISGVYVLSVQLENGTKEIFRVVVK